MDRRTFLRMAGVAGLVGGAGCSTPFDPVTTPEPVRNGSAAGTANGAGNPDGSGNPNGGGNAGGSGNAGGGGSGEADGTPTTTPEAPATRSGTALTGVYSGNTGLAENLSAFSTWASQKPAVVMVFADAFAGADATRGFVEGALTNIWNAGHVPLISWQPFLQNRQRTPEPIERRIASGEYDDQLQVWADALSSWVNPDGRGRGRRFYFRPAHEMNGNWFPWSAVDSSQIDATTNTPGTPEDYVSMWRRLHRTFADAGMDGTDVQWVWSPNVDEPGTSVRAERYYPGDEFVDWVGLVGFNFGGSQVYENGSRSNWRSPTGLFDSMLSRMERLTDKPKALAEFASSSVPDSGNGHRPQQKAEWIEDAFSYVAENDIKMTCWFNVHKTGPDESDWSIFGGEYGTAETSIDGDRYATYPAYRNAVSASEYLGARPDYPPLLTDDEFAGRF